MWFVVIGVLLILFKVFDVGLMVDISWWWVLFLFVLVILWWEFVDKVGYM